MKTILLIGSGGFIGSVARYGLQQLISRFYPSVFPSGTLLVNLAGCFAIGLIYGLSERNDWMNEDWKLFLAIGLCGGFTTFSSFSYENVRLIRDGQYGLAFLYIAASVLLGVALTFAGIYLARN